LLKICIKLLGKRLALKASNQMNLLMSLTKNSWIWRHINGHADGAPTPDLDSKEFKKPATKRGAHTYTYTYTHTYTYT
jgi:hypothetical protein